MPGRPVTARHLELRALSNLALTLQAVACRLSTVVAELERARGAVGLTEAQRLTLGVDLRRVGAEVAAAAACLDPGSPPLAIQLSPASSAPR